MDVRKALRIYAGISKFRLGALVVATTAGGFIMAPISLSFSSAACFATTLVGTGLCVSSANTLNQVIEVEHDAVMRRTFNRPIAAGQITRNNALAVGVASGLAGVTMLHTLVNPLTAKLGLANILLYAFGYTPLKRLHPINTWVGAVVGGIPPMMGWTAATAAISPQAWALFTVLYLWQMPHFFALSYLVKEDYRTANFAMLVCEQPQRVADLSVAYTTSMFLLGPLCCATGLTHWEFVVDATALTTALLYTSLKFQAMPNKQTSRVLFLATIAYLPILMLIMYYHKRETTPQDQDEQH